MMTNMAVGDELPFAVFVLKYAVAVVHGVVANGYQTIHDKDENKIETQLFPETTTVPVMQKTYGEPQRGRKEKMFPRGPRGASLAFAPASVANPRI